MRFVTFIMMMLFFATSCSSDSKSEIPSAHTTLNTAEASNRSGHLPASPPDTGEPAMHAIHNSRLQQIMDQINALAYTQMSSEDHSKERQLKTEEIAKIARQLAANEKAITGTLPSLNLNPSEESAFAALANKLRVSAEHMEALANQNQIQAIPAAMETIISTCTSCHTLFRKSRSILERCKDPNSTC